MPKTGKTRSLHEIYNATNTVEDYFVSIVDSDISALHSYVIDDIVAFVPILTLDRFYKVQIKTNGWR